MRNAHQQDNENADMIDSISCKKTQYNVAHTIIKDNGKHQIRQHNIVPDRKGKQWTEFICKYIVDAACKVKGQPIIDDHGD